MNEKIFCVCWQSEIGELDIQAWRRAWIRHRLLPPVKETKFVGLSSLIMPKRIEPGARGSELDALIRTLAE